jgi:glycosyltransferase involved in cell wall biosynthesis
MTNIAIDSGPLVSGDSVRGIGVYTRELLKALKMDGVDLSHADLYKYEVVHFTRFNPFNICLPFHKPNKTKFVLTIYDLIPLIYPEHYPPGVKGWINWQVNKFLIKRNVDAIITISETSKKDICRFLGVSSNKVHVIYLAPRSIFRKFEITKYGELPDHFVLYVGDVNFNKNIPLLVRSCKLANIPLVICGKQAANIEKSNLNHPELVHLKNIDWSGVIRLGFVSDEDLVKIYNLADIYIQPSFYEGFGLPILEANAVGVPVICAKSQALVEIAENSALFSDPKDPKDFATKIKLLMKDQNLRKTLIQKGLENAKKYSWQKTAEETNGVYQRLIGFK